MKKIEKFIINESMTIRDVVIHMNNNNIHIVICKNYNKKIIGIFTEGDFRRLIFKGFNIDDKILKYLNKNFIYVTKRHIENQKRYIFLQEIYKMTPRKKRQISKSIIFIA